MKDGDTGSFREPRRLEAERLFAFQQETSAILNLQMAEKGEIRPDTVPPAAVMVTTGKGSNSTWIQRWMKNETELSQSPI